MKNLNALFIAIMSLTLTTGCPGFDIPEDGDSPFNAKLYSMAELDGYWDGYSGEPQGNITVIQGEGYLTQGLVTFDIKNYFANPVTNVDKCLLWLNVKSYSMNSEYFAFAISHVTFTSMDYPDVIVLNNDDSPDFTQQDIKFQATPGSLQGGAWITADVTAWCSEDIQRQMKYTQYGVRLNNSYVEGEIQVVFQEGIPYGDPKYYESGPGMAPRLEISYK